VGARAGKGARGGANTLLHLLTGGLSRSMWPVLILREPHAVVHFGWMVDVERIDRCGPQRTLLAMGRVPARIRLYSAQAGRGLGGQGRCTQVGHGLGILLIGPISSNEQ
jgi:hypothetical protein